MTLLWVIRYVGNTLNRYTANNLRIVLKNNQIFKNSTSNLFGFSVYTLYSKLRLFIYPMASDRHYEEFDLLIQILLNHHQYDSQQALLKKKVLGHYNTQARFFLRLQPPSGRHPTRVCVPLRAGTECRYSPGSQPFADTRGTTASKFRVIVLVKA